MEIYKNYPLYVGWEVFQFEYSIFKYYNKFKNGKSKGAYLLTNDKEALTADILTSIRRPFNHILKNKKLDINIKDLDDLNSGSKISKYLQELDINNYKEAAQLLSYLKAFAIVYYWCGNMMPIVCNWNGNGDECVHKISVMLEAFDENKYYSDFLNGEINGRVYPKKLYRSWISQKFKDNEKNNKVEKVKKEFFCGNYLNDYFNDEWKIRDNICHFNYKKDFEEKVAVNWLIINTKLIVQRSYRILFDFKENWDKSPTDEKNVVSLIEYIYKQAGVKEEQISLF
ncbi:hypothetical protein [Parvimonas sp. G1967]|uniref:hypothetical protein n=1 Tax=Parvimonas sp. G1967 TaxID=3387695 RepID=UPI0039E2B7B4